MQIMPINSILKVSQRVGAQRDREDVLCSIMEEVGELATEVRIAKGSSYKTKGVALLVKQLTQSYHWLILFM